MFKWKVRLQGDITDLALLAKNHGSGAFRVLNDGEEGFFYESDSFASLETEKDVREKARLELATLSGLLRLHYGSIRGVELGAVCKIEDNGRKAIYVQMNEESHARDFMDAQAFRVDESGALHEIPSNPATRIDSRVSAGQSLAGTDEVVEKALRLLGAEDGFTWVGLYRVYEVVAQDVGGRHALDKKDWVRESELSRFTHSANSPDVGGDLARHGHLPGQPPKDPMSLSEAIPFIKQLVKDWLQERGA